MLRELIDRLSGPLPSDEARATLDGPELVLALDRLVAAGRDRTAVELLQRIVALPEALHRDPRRRPTLRMLLGERLAERLAHEALRPVLMPIVDDREYGARALFLLAEAAERVGDVDGARRLYERVLARDLDFPKARARHARLRPEAESTTSTAPTMAGLEVDKTAVGDRYRLRGELGRGATSTVYLAHDVELDRDVALKLLHPHASARVRAEARLRSFREARIASSLRHPGVVAILDLDEERGLLVMELCAGGTLRDRLARARPGVGPGPRMALEVARSLLTTLAAVHEAGVVHRDLKPGNLLFRERPLLDEERAARGAGGTEGPAVEDELVLADFGLALLDDRALSARPAGTIDYLAPEARRGEPGAGSDVYACGVILHELLTGERPGTREEILRGETPTLAELPQGIDDVLGAGAAERLRALMMDMVAAGPEARPTAVEAARRIGEVMERRDATRE